MSLKGLVCVATVSAGLSLDPSARSIREPLSPPDASDVSCSSRSWTGPVGEEPER